MKYRHETVTCFDCGTSVEKTKAVPKEAGPLGNQEFHCQDCVGDPMI